MTWTQRALLVGFGFFVGLGAGQVIDFVLPVPTPPELKFHIYNEEHIAPVVDHRRWA